MYNHSSIHIATIIFTSGMVLAVTIAGLIQIHRGNGQIVRQRLLSYFGMIFLFTGTILSGGRYDVLADIIRFAGFGLMGFGAIKLSRLARQQTLEKKAREIQQRKANRPAI